MTPPGDGLEFHGTEYYQKIAKVLPGLDAAIQAAIRNRPNAGTLVAGRVKELKIQFEKTDYIVFFIHRGNDVGLTAVYKEKDSERIKAKKADLKKTFGAGGLK